MILAIANDVALPCNKSLVNLNTPLTIHKPMHLFKILNLNTSFTTFQSRLNSFPYNPSLE